LLSGSDPAAKSIGEKDKQAAQFYFKSDFLYLTVKASSSISIFNKNASNAQI
jgi:hypothetical protein